MYNFCPSELKVSLGTKSCSLVIITLQLSAAWKIKLASFSISIFNSIFVLGSSLSSNASKKEYLLRRISQFTVADTPNSAFLAAKPLLYSALLLANWFVPLTSNSLSSASLDVSRK